MRQFFEAESNKKKDKRRKNKEEYTFTITETLKLSVAVEADSAQEAEMIAECNYYNQEYILDAENFAGVVFEGKEKTRNRDDRER